VAPHRLKSGWWVLGGLAAGGALWFGIPRLARTLDFFRLRRVEFHGISQLTPDRLMPAIRLAEDASIFTSLEGIEERLRAIPGVREASVHRRIPGSLRVDIEEARPVALAPSREGAMILVDERGRTLPFDPAVSAPDLPIMSRPDSEVAGVLARVREVDPGLFARVISASKHQKDVVLQVDSQRYWFRPNASAEAILAVTAVAADLALKKWDYAELDGRFADQVIVRRRGA
jgi:cell division septal protein FtsQ